MTAKAFMFTTPTCMPCKAVKPAFIEVSKDFPSVETSVMEITKESPEAALYGIRSTPCFVFIKDDEVIDNVKKMMTKTEIRKNFEKIQ